VNDAAIFLAMVVSSLSAGALFSFQGWQAMNFYALPVLVVTGGAILWLAMRRPSQQPA
jgi:hypothetical protein